MDLNILQTCILLFQMICVVIVFAYLFTRSRFFSEVLERRPAVATQVLLVVIFGILSIYGLSSGLSVSGATANIRDLGPIIRRADLRALCWSRCRAHWRGIPPHHGGTQCPGCCGRAGHCRSCCRPCLSCQQTGDYLGEIGDNLYHRCGIICLGTGPYCQDQPEDRRPVS